MEERRRRKQKKKKKVTGSREGREWLTQGKQAWDLGLEGMEGTHQLDLQP